jgi:hypothetical protein
MYDDRSLRKQNKLVADSNLTQVLGTRGLGHLLQRIELSERGIYKLADLTEFVEIMRRLYIPYWEEARLYWETSLKEGSHDGCGFDENTLIDIIKEYGESEESASKNERG